MESPSLPTASQERVKPRWRMAVAPLAATLALAGCTSSLPDHMPQSLPTISTVPETLPSPTIAPSSVPPSSTTAPSTPATESGLEGCKPYFDLSQYTNHEYEVCVAYVSNAADIALQGYYKYGNNATSYVRDAAQHHIETRYWDQPRSIIEQRVASWPATSSITGNNVEESITVMNVTANLGADRGLLQTEEAWHVTAPNGTVLFSQPEHAGRITMCRGRLPGHILHEWVVVHFSAQPSFDCIGFDHTHGISP
ncbi:MAG TPA: hypothetical protein VFN56_04035 [Candidatus Saccharimonadales bacterium]|nr:hypothetical protein [Candidatus Saccharimonadales bacterium]